MTTAHANNALAVDKSTQRDRMADLLRPIVQKIVDERLAELTADELEQLRAQWRATDEH